MCNVRPCSTTARLILVVACAGAACGGSVEPAATAIADSSAPHDAHAAASDAVAQADSGDLLDGSGPDVDAASQDASTWAPDRLLPGPCVMSSVRHTSTNTGHGAAESSSVRLGHFTYEQDRLVGESFLDIGTSIENSLIRHEYDAAGERVASYFDFDGDGATDETQWFEYEDGELVVRDTDWDGDGLVDERAMFSYDADGRKVSGEADYGADGTVEGSWRYDYELDVEGRVVEERTTRDGEDDPWHIWTFAYDGGEVSAETQWAYDGFCQRTDAFEHTYDGFGNRLGTIVDSDVSACGPFQTWQATGHDEQAFTFDCFADAGGDTTP